MKKIITIALLALSTIVFAQKQKPMKTILDLITAHAAEIGTFLITAGAAWIKRKIDLKKIKKEQAENFYKK